MGLPAACRAGCHLRLQKPDCFVKQENVEGVPFSSWVHRRNQQPGAGAKLIWDCNIS